MPTCFDFSIIQDISLMLFTLPQLEIQLYASLRKMELAKKTHHPFYWSLEVDFKSIPHVSFLFYLIFLAIDRTSRFIKQKAMRCTSLSSVTELMLFVDKRESVSYTGTGPLGALWSDTNEMSSHLPRATLPTQWKPQILSPSKGYILCVAPFYLSYLFFHYSPFFCGMKSKRVMFILLLKVQVTGIVHEKHS